jgi:Flp pilus assembly protein TadG
MAGMKRRTSERGSAMVEFALAGVASVVLLISTFQLAIGMWNYHTLAYAVHEITRYIAVRGTGCTQPGNTCSVTVGTIAQRIAAVGIGLPSNKVNVTLTTQSGAITPCAPLNTCFSNVTVWPPATNSDNQVGTRITVSAKYQFQGALLFFWPGQAAQSYGAVWLPASSTQQIVF